MLELYGCGGLVVTGFMGLRGELYALGLCVSQ